MERRWLDDREQRAWRAFLDLQRVLRIGIERQLAESGLSSADYELLVPLSEAPGRRMRPRDLGAQVGWDRSRLAHHLRRMEDRGLVAREECSTDARGILIRLTERGLKTMEAAAPGHVEWVRTNFIDKLTRAELDALTRLSERVVSKIEGG
jgi:DNA-binding MarR family transcriptional regulator